MLFWTRPFKFINISSMCLIYNWFWWFHRDKSKRVESGVEVSQCLPSCQSNYPGIPRLNTVGWDENNVVEHHPTENVFSSCNNKVPCASIWNFSLWVIRGSIVFSSIYRYRLAVRNCSRNIEVIMEFPRISAQTITLCECCVGPYRKMRKFSTLQYWKICLLTLNIHCWNRYRWIIVSKNFIRLS